MTKPETYLARLVKAYERLKDADGSFYVTSGSTFEVIARENPELFETQYFTQRMVIIRKRTQEATNA